MHAIIVTGGKQFRVAPGDVDSHSQNSPPKSGAEVALIAKWWRFHYRRQRRPAHSAKATLAPVRVNATISAQDRADKILRYSNSSARSNTSARRGHRQPYTEVRIRDIVA